MLIKMGILGRGHHSIVVAAGDKYVEKFYSSAKEARREAKALGFVQNLSVKGFDIRCKIPAFIGKVEQGRYRIGDELFHYKGKMDRLYGVQMSKMQNLNFLVGDLAQIIASFHVESRPFIKTWTQNSGPQDHLLNHILKDKAGLVLKKETSKEIRTLVRNAANYLAKRDNKLKKEWTLSHLDINPTNVLIKPHGQIEGLVDWGSFGLTHPSISLYQLVDLKIWPKFRKEYSRSGPAIRDDLLYASAAIHFAWVPLRNQELGFRPDFKKNHFASRKYYMKFDHVRSRS